QLDSEVQDVLTEVSSVSPGEISIITILDELINQLDGHLKVNQEQSMVNDSLRAELARSLGSSNPWYAKQTKIAQPTLYDGHALLKPTNTPVRVHDSEESLVQAEVSRTKMSNRPETIKPINYAELNALYGHFVPQNELSREQFIGYLLKNLPLRKVTHLNLKDDIIRKLQTQINSMSILNVELTVGSFDKQALETELTQLKDAVISVRIQNDGFKVENVNLK
nr:hypothetical protein [Tanacetum cinerariifolium]